MIKEFLLDYYIQYFENIFNSNNKNKIKKAWERVKNNETVMNLAINIENNKIKSKIIAYMILTDKNLYYTDIYNSLINKIYKNQTLAREKVKNSNSFLMLTLDNENLILTKEQKIFLLYEAENSPNTEKYYKEGEQNKKNIHGTGILDIRYALIKNHNFSLQEKKNIFTLLYPDDEIKIVILEELEWYIKKEIEKYTNIKYNNINDISEEDIKCISNNTKKSTFIDLINLHQNVKESIPETAIKKYINND